ncbi:sushi, von Willebrand factor type A, EGF and pentraxin domain-containing protein 1-like [Watersipora subatra]|uniref:sushi, von Willebrand factor type A, EGF and pentraxin domain-containing protein 1-like n=1 Tax=Watersipora subatra TaxID=2589382 RepID=UPI00355BEA47
MDMDSYLLLLVFSLLHLPKGVHGDCPYISVPAGTNRSSDEVTNGLTVEYNCLDVTEIFENGRADMRIRCLSSGQWNELPQPCKVVRCGAQPLVHHSAVTTTSTIAGVQVTIRCIYGFGFPDSSATKVITCNETTLTWQLTEDDVWEGLTCNQRYCHHFPSPYPTLFYLGMEAYLPNGTIAMGSVITSYCLEGYFKMPSNIQRSGKCSATGLLDGSYQDCIVRTCDTLLQPPNTWIQYNNNVYQRRVRYVCNTGFFPGGKDHHVMECDHNGQWKSEPASSGCQAGACDEGWIKHDNYCYYVSNHRSLGLRYYYAEDSCLLKKSHLASVNSSEENSFIYANTYKKYERDYWIGYHFDVVTNDWSWFKDSDEMILYKKWHRGYPELKSSCARLTINGVWKDRNCDDLMAYVCKKPTMCGPPPVIQNGGPDIATLPQTMDVGDSLVYKCNIGYSFRNDAAVERVVSCLLGAYYSAIENCQPVMCPALNRVGYYIENAVITSDSQVGTYLSTVTWSCNPGYIFPDGTFTKDILCQANRTWSFVPDMCIKVYCRVPAILNAIPEYGSRRVGEGDYYECEPGYEFPNGELRRMMICQLDGSWLPSDSCWKRRCQPYVQYNANITEGARGIARYQELAEITCNRGYQFPDGSITKQTRCGADFHWSPYLPLCEPKKCPGGTPPAVPNASANTTAGIIETVVEYTCNDGFFFIDGDTQRTAICDIFSLDWVGVPIECFSSLPDQQVTDIGINQAFSIAIAVIVILFLVIGMWLIICSDCKEDRQLIGMCVDYSKEEEDEESYAESIEPEPIRLQMVM